MILTDHNPQVLYDCREFCRAPQAKLDIAAGHAMQIFWFLIIKHIQLSWIASPLLYAIVGLRGLPFINKDCVKLARPTKN
jgi:hypothetical protein